MPDTIAAIATPQLPSAIGILRLSGPDTRRILDVVFSPAHGGPLSPVASFIPPHGPHPPQGRSGAGRPITPRRALPLLPAVRTGPRMPALPALRRGFLFRPFLLRNIDTPALPRLSCRDNARDGPTPRKDKFDDGY